MPSVARPVPPPTRKHYTGVFHRHNMVMEPPSNAIEATGDPEEDIWESEGKKRPKWAAWDDPKVPNTTVFYFRKEDSTLACLMTAAMQKRADVLFAGYKIPHPYDPKFELRVTTDGNESPHAVLYNCLMDLTMEVDILAKRWNQEFLLWQATTDGKQDQEERTKLRGEIEERHEQFKQDKTTRQAEEDSQLAAKNARAVTPTADVPMDDTDAEYEPTYSPSIGFPLDTNAPKEVPAGFRFSGSSHPETSPAFSFSQGSPVQPNRAMSPTYPRDTTAGPRYRMSPTSPVMSSGSISPAGSFSPSEPFGFSRASSPGPAPVFGSPGFSHLHTDYLSHLDRAPAPHGLSGFVHVAAPRGQAENQFNSTTRVRHEEGTNRTYRLPSNYLEDNPSAGSPGFTQMHDDRLSQLDASSPVGFGSGRFDSNRFEGNFASGANANNNLFNRNFALGSNNLPSAGSLSPGFSHMHADRMNQFDHTSGNSGPSAGTYRRPSAYIDPREVIERQRARQEANAFRSRGRGRGRGYGGHHEGRRYHHGGRDNYYYNAPRNDDGELDEEERRLEAEEEALLMAQAHPTFGPGSGSGSPIHVQTSPNSPMMDSPMSPTSSTMDPYSLGSPMSPTSPNGK